MLIKESEDKAEEIEEAERDNEESAGKGRASELIKLNKDIRMVIDSLKEHMSSIMDTLRALIQASYY